MSVNTAELVKFTALRTLCRGATPGRMWSTEAVERLKRAVESYAGDLIVSVSLHDPTVRYGKTQRIYARQIDDAIRQRESGYTAWLEEELERVTRAAKAAGVTLPKGRPAPLPSKRGDA